MELHSSVIWARTNINTMSSVELGSQTVSTDLQWCEVAGCWHRLASPEREEYNKSTKIIQGLKIQNVLRPSTDFAFLVTNVQTWSLIVIGCNWVCILSVQPAWWRARKTLNTTFFVSRWHAVVIAQIKIRPLQGYLCTSLRRIHSYSLNSFKPQEWMLSTVQLVPR